MALSSGAQANDDHNDLASCYDYVAAQCTGESDEVDCMEFGINDCNGSYPGVNPALPTRSTDSLRVTPERAPQRIQPSTGGDLQLRN